MQTLSSANADRFAREQRCLYMHDMSETWRKFKCCLTEARMCSASWAFVFARIRATMPIRK